MSEGAKPEGTGAGKVVLIVVLVLIGLGVLCCAGLAFVGRDYIRGTFEFGQSSSEFVERLQTDFGKGTTFNFIPDEEDAGMVVVVGVPGGPKEGEIDAAHDKVWIAYCDAFEEGGFPIAAVAVGTAGEGGGNDVKRWRDHRVPAADVAARTGRAAPPPSKLFEKINAERVKAEGTADEEDEGAPGEDAPEDTPK